MTCPSTGMCESVPKIKGREVSLLRPFRGMAAGRHSGMGEAHVGMPRPGGKGLSFSRKPRVHGCSATKTRP